MSDIDLTKLKPGDRVAYSTDAGWTRDRDRWHVVTVERLTPTQIVLSNKMRVRIADNRWVGRDNWGAALVRADDPRIAESARMDAWDELRYKLSQFERTARPKNAAEVFDVLDAIEDAVTECRKAIAATGGV